MMTETEVDNRVGRLRDNVLTAVTATKTHRISRAGRTAIILGASALALSLTGGTVAVVQATQEQITYSVTCYEEASLTSNYTTVASPLAVNTDTGDESRDATDPVASCSEMWRMGLIGQDQPPTDPNAANFPVPELVGCTQSNGVGVAFPRRDSTASDVAFCQNLGLAIWD